MEIDNFTLYLDDREKAIIPFFESVVGSQRCRFTWEVRRLVHGDYCITYNEHLVMIIERKTWADLAASIKDKRILNIENLKILRGQSKCRLILLMEGRTPRGDVAHVSLHALKSKLDHLMIRDEILIVYTHDESDTAERLISLIRSMVTIVGGLNLPDSKEVVEEILGGAASPAITLLKEEKQALEIWCTFPRVDLMTSKALVDAGHTVLELAGGKITADVIAELKYPSGRLIGMDNARSIVAGARTRKTHIAILASINGVSTVTAEKILDLMDGDLANFDDITKRMVTCIRRSNGKKLGLAVAKRVFKLLE